MFSMRPSDIFNASPNFGHSPLKFFGGCYEEESVAPFPWSQIRSVAADTYLQAPLSPLFQACRSTGKTFFRTHSTPSIQCRDEGGAPCDHHRLSALAALAAAPGMAPSLQLIVDFSAQH
jgi:hypothetical protein